MARKKQISVRERYNMWLEHHPVGGDIVVGASVAAAVIVLFLFVTFSGFGSSAEFIYNQF